MEEFSPHKREIYTKAEITIYDKYFKKFAAIQCHKKWFWLKMQIKKGQCHEGEEKWNKKRIGSLTDLEKVKNFFAKYYYSSKSK